MIILYIKYNKYSFLVSLLIVQWKYGYERKHLSHFITLYDWRYTTAYWVTRRLSGVTVATRRRLWWSPAVTRWRWCSGQTGRSVMEDSVLATPRPTNRVRSVLCIIQKVSNQMINWYMYVYKYNSPNKQSKIMHTLLIHLYSIVYRYRQVLSNRSMNVTIHLISLNQER